MKTFIFSPDDSVKKVREQVFLRNDNIHVAVICNCCGRVLGDATGRDFFEVAQRAIDIAKSRLLDVEHDVSMTVTANFIAK